MPSATSGRQVRRRRLQFGLRGLLLFTLIVCVVLSSFSVRLYRKRQERAAVAAVEALRGHVTYDWERTLETDLPIRSKKTPPGPAWARRFLGDDFFAEVFRVSFFEASGAKDVDAVLAKLQALTGIRELYLDGSDVSDAGLVHLPVLRRLESLSLHDTDVCGPGLGELSRLPSLKELFLDHSPIDDTSLGYLKGCRSVERLSIVLTKVRGSGLASLGDNLPSLNGLSLDLTQIGDDSLQHLKTCNSLVELDLRGTRVCGSGVASLADLPRLAVLDLSLNKLTGEGIKSLSRLKGLRILWLDGSTGIDDECLKALSGLTSLMLLAIPSENITERGLSYLSRLPHLRQLSVTRAPLTDAEMAVLAEIRTLQLLDVSGSPEAEETLRARLPKCELGFLRGGDAWISLRDEILREKD